MFNYVGVGSLPSPNKRDDFRVLFEADDWSRNTKMQIHILRLQRARIFAQKKWHLFTQKTNWFFLSIHAGPLALYVNCCPVACQTRIQYQVESYQRLKRCYLIPAWLTLISYVSRVNWSNEGKVVALSSIPECSTKWKRSFRLAVDDCSQLIYIYIYIYIYIIPLWNKIFNNFNLEFLHYR